MNAAPLGLDEANTAKLLKVFGTCKTKFAMFFSSSLQDILFFFVVLFIARKLRM